MFIYQNIANGKLLGFNTMRNQSWYRHSGRTCCLHLHIDWLRFTQTL